jgi:Tfp pilus assembly protein PilZ
MVSQLYSIDRQTVVRIPTLGTSNRTLPVGVAIKDRARVQALVNRFESLWAEAIGASRGPAIGQELVRSPSGSASPIAEGP